MDISAIEGEELRSVAFVEDYLELRFGTPLLTLFSWPYVMLPEFSVAFGDVCSHPFTGFLWSICGPFSVGAEPPLAHQDMNRHPPL